MPNLLAVDIGNSSISFGIFKGKKLIADFKLSTQHKSVSFYQRAIRSSFRKLKIKEEGVREIILCSVVPQKTPTIKNALAGIFKKKILVAGKDIPVPIKNNYRIPRQVGIDRLLGAFAALKRYGPGLIIVDFGTAVTIDIVSRKSEFLGGLIFPGIDLSLDALSHHTALLPRVTIARPQRLVGNDTVSAITAGIVFGMAGMFDAIIQILKEKYRGYKVIATGGSINFIKRYSSQLHTARRSLVLEGLSLLLND